MNNKFKPAIIGGVVIGLLSAIPFVNLANICCCLWAILGGIITSYLYIKSSPVPAQAGDGAVLGALAGLIGAVIYLVVGIPISILLGDAMIRVMTGMIEGVDPAQAELLRRQMEASQNIVSVIIQSLIVAVLLVVFSTIGGLLAVPIFEKRKVEMAPPPPPNYGEIK